MNIEQDCVELVEGKGGLKKLKVVNPYENTSAEIYLHGAHLTSFVVDGEEMIYVSKDAVFSETSKIRGGIPVCFPQFADRGKLDLAHGFARSSDFFLLEKHEDKLKGEVSCVLRLIDSLDSRRVWDNKFVLDMRYTLFKKSLLCDVSISNLNCKKNFEFTFALHSYYNIKHISTLVLEGVNGTKFIDKMRKSEVFEEKSKILVIDKEVDRIYLDCKNPVIVKDKESRVMGIMKEGFEDIVIWNPWIDKSKRMGDLPNEDYKKFVCIEIGQMGDSIKLGPGQVWKGRMLVSK